MASKEQEQDSSLPGPHAVQEQLLEGCSEVLDLRDGASVFEMEIGVDLAKGILRHLNKQNIRSKDQRIVREYTEAMGGGHWYRNYDCVVFVGDELSLGNGQHRLAAVVASGRPQVFLVVIYAGELTAKGQDTGKKRQIYTTHGVSLADAAAARVVHMLVVGQQNTTRDGVEETCAEYPEIREFGSVLRSRKTTRQAHVVGAFALAAHNLDLPERKTLYELARDLAEIGGQCPMSAPITRLLENDRATQSIQQRCDTALALLRGLEAHLEGAVLHILRPTATALRRFAPNARYRLQVPSPELPGRRNRVAS